MRSNDTPNELHHPAIYRGGQHSVLQLWCYFLILSFLLFGSIQHVAVMFSRPLTSGKRQQHGIPKIESADTNIIQLPSLDELIAPNGTIIGDISWMLDFAIIAFPKAGTTFMKDHLNQTQESYVYEREFCMKRYTDVTDFVRQYHNLHVRYNQPRHPKTMQFGLKCPGVFYRANDIHIYERYFPATKFIIGLRHPVSWFESFYNYQSYRNVSLPPTSHLIGRCIDHRKVCTDRARFHAALARLGKTPMKDEEEMGLLLGSRYEKEHGQMQRNNNSSINANDVHRRRRLRKNNKGLPNQVLLYEIRQIHNTETSNQLSSRIQQYLGIKQQFPPILSFQQNKTRTINICDDEHEDVRRILVEHGTDAASWIEKYLVKTSGVDVSSPESFHQLLGDWSHDPC